MDGERKVGVLTGSYSIKALEDQEEAAGKYNSEDNLDGFECSGGKPADLTDNNSKLGTLLVVAEQPVHISIRNGKEARTSCSAPVGAIFRHISSDGPYSVVELKMDGKRKVGVLTGSNSLRALDDQKNAARKYRSKDNLDGFDCR